MPAIIRLTSEADAEQIQAIYAPIVRDTPISFEYDIPSVGDMAGRIRDKRSHGYPWLAAAHGGVIMGYAYGGRWRERTAYQWTVEVTVYVHAAYRRMGVGRGLYVALLNVLRLQGFVTAVAGITLPNEGSVRVHEAVGFKPVGVYQGVGYKFGRWHDVGWWECAIQSPSPQPSPALDVKALVDTPDWDRALAEGHDCLRL
jgi:phosphinothricin acetyltransferase